MLRQLVCYQVLATWSGRCFCFLLETFSVQAYVNLNLHPKRASNRRLPPRVWFGPQHWEGAALIGACSWKACIVFYACKCFVFWSRRKDVNRVAGLTWLQTFSLFKLRWSRASSLKTDHWNFQFTEENCAGISGTPTCRSGGVVFFLVFFSVHHQVAIAA